MRLLELIGRAFVIAYWIVVFGLALVVGVALWWCFRLFVGEQPRRRTRPVHASANEQRDYGDETDAPAPRYCLLCGLLDRLPGSITRVCPDCGGCAWGTRPDLPIAGEPRERR